MLFWMESLSKSDLLMLGFLEADIILYWLLICGSNLG